MELEEERPSGDERAMKQESKRSLSDEPPGFTDGFRVIDARLNNTGFYWIGTKYQEEIGKQVDRMDKAFLDNDFPAFKATIFDLDDLVSRAVLEYLEGKNLLAKVKARVLGREVWIVPNKEVKKILEMERLVGYLPDEIQHIRGLAPSVREALCSAMVELNTKLYPHLYE